MKQFLKRSLSLLLVLCMVATCLPTVAFAADPETDAAPQETVETVQQTAEEPAEDTAEAEEPVLLTNEPAEETAAGHDFYKIVHLDAGRK